MVSELTNELVTDILVEEFAKLSSGQTIPNLYTNAEFKAAFVEAYEGISKIVYEEMKSGSRYQNTKLVGLTFREEDDEWVRKWKKRVGYPLEEYKRNFDKLEDFAGPA